MFPWNSIRPTVCDLALDMGIAPLVDDPFNQHKSCIKYYEYAMSGAITVASHVLPYSTEVPFTAKNNREAWKQKLGAVLEADREAMWREQRDWVLTHRNIENNVALWERVLDGAVGRSAADPSLRRNLCLHPRVAVKENLASVGSAKRRRTRRPTGASIWECWPASRSP